MRNKLTYFVVLVEGDMKPEQEAYLDRLSQEGGFQGGGPFQVVILPDTRTELTPKPTVACAPGMTIELE